LGPKDPVSICETNFDNPLGVILGSGTNILTGTEKSDTPPVAIINKQNGKALETLVSKSRSLGRAVRWRPAVHLPIACRPATLVGDVVITETPTALIQLAMRYGCRWVDGRDIHAGQADALTAFFATAMGSELASAHEPLQTTC
jgi:shikimate 5-dehydrogenase